MLNKKTIWFWLTFALILRLFKAGQVYCIAKDGVRYIDAAYSLINGTGFSAIWPPFYPFLMSLLIRLGISPELSGQLISIIFGVITVIMVYILTRKIFSQSIAEISALLAIFHPYLVRYSAEVLADSVFTCLIVIIIYLGWLGLEKKNVGLAVITGFFTSLAYLTKPEGIILGVIISFWWLFSAGTVRKKGNGSVNRDRKHCTSEVALDTNVSRDSCEVQQLSPVHRSVARKIINVITLWSVFFITAYPYLHSVEEQTGHWVISQKQSIAFSISLQDEGLADTFLNVSPIGYAVGNPYLFTKKILKNILALAGRVPDAYSPFMFILLLFGLFTKWDSRQKKGLKYILSFIITFFIGYAVFYPGRRYLVNWVPVTLFFAAYGCQKIIKIAGGGRHIKAVILSIIIILTLPKTLCPVRGEGARWKEAGKWIKKNLGENVKIMSEDSRVAFYAGVRDIPWAIGGAAEADYIVSGGPIEGFRQIHKTGSGVLIYKT